MVVAAHGLVEYLDAEVAMAVVHEDDEVPGVDGVRVDEAPPAVMEEHLPLTVEHHLHGPQASHGTGHTQEDMVGLLPVDNRGEPLGQAQPILAHAWWMVMPNSKPERSMATRSGDDGGDGDTDG